nr:toxin VasX [uncultured Halomonas sp.]
MNTSMEAANRVAEHQSDNDPGQETGQCPLTQEKLQLIPVRYALVEAEQAVATAGFSPPITGDFRPDGIRPARQGWLYLIHSIAPETLQTFRVAPDGSGDIILLERRGSIQVLYSQVELEEKRAALLLAKPDVQAEVMLTVHIGAYCPGNGTTHLLPPETLSECLADDHGTRQASTQRLDYGRYQWTEGAEWRSAKARDLKGQILGGYQQDSACLIVSDVVARAKDLLGAWTEVARQESDWLDEAPEKHFAARAIDGFMQLDLAPMTANAGKGDIPGWLGNADDNDREQLQRLMDLQNQRDAKRRDDLMHSGGHPGFKSNEQRALTAEIHQISEALAGRLETDAEVVREFAEDTHDDYFERVFGSQEGNHWLAQEGIEDIVRLDEMRHFIAQADHWQAEWRQHKEQIGHDLKTLLPHWHEYASLLDGEDDTQAILRSSLEHQLFTTLSACGQQAFLVQHYFTEITTAHRLHVTPTLGFINSAATNWKHALASLTGLMASQSAPGSHAQWQQRLAEQQHLRLQGLKDLGEEARAVVVAELTTKEDLMGRALLANLVDEVDELDLEQRFSALFSQTSPGMRHQLYTRFAAYQLGWDIPDQAILNRIERVLARTERLAAELTPLGEQERRLERQRKQMPKRDYDSAVRRVRRARNLKRQELAAVLDELVETTYPHNAENTHVVRVAGLSEAPSNAALRERRAYRQSLEEVGNWDAVLRNEQGEIAPSRAIPVGVSGMMLMLNGVLLGFAIKQLATALSTRERIGEEFLNTISSISGTVAAVASVCEILHDTRYRRLFEGKSFQAAVQQASGSFDHLNDWARLTNRAMIGVAGFSALAGFLDGFRQVAKLDRADNDSQRVATSIALVGDVAVFGGTAPIAMRGLIGLFRAEAAIELRLTLLRWAVPLNWFAAVGVILVILGELLYEYYSLSPLQQWCRQSAWGRAPQGWDLARHHQQLARLHGDPVLWRRGQQPERLDSLPVGPQRPASSLNIRLNLPGIASPNSHNLALGLWGITGSTQVALHQDLLAHASVIEEGANCRLEYALDPDRVGHWYGLVLVARITAEGAQAPTATVAFQVFSRADRLAPKEDWSPVTPIDGIGGQAWRSRPLTPWQA